MFANKLAKNLSSKSIHMGKLILDHFDICIFSTKISNNLQNLPNLSQMVPKGPQTTPKHVQQKSEKCPKTVSVGPGIEPGTLRIRLRDRSEDQPIGLILYKKIFFLYKTKIFFL